MPKPGEKRQIPVVPGGALKDAVFVEIVNQNEPWSSYDLSDGTTIRAKTVVSEIWRIENEYDPEGNPQYFIRAQPLIAVNSPTELMMRKVN